MARIKNKAALVIAISAFICWLFVVAPAKSDENRSVRLKTNRQHSSILSLNDIVGKGMVIGIDAQHMLRLMEMDPNLYVLYIGDGTEFEGGVGGLKKAVNITLKQIKENKLRFPKDRTLILVSPSGQQSLMAAKILAAKGLVVHYVIGGMNALKKLKNQKPMFLKEKTNPEKEKKTIRHQKNGQHYPKSIFEEEDMGC